MTSCKPPPTCIDASPIPDANDSRMSAIPYEANLTPMGLHPLLFSCWAEHLALPGQGEPVSHRDVRGLQSRAYSGSAAGTVRTAASGAPRRTIPPEPARSGTFAGRCTNDLMRIDVDLR